MPTPPCRGRMPSRCDRSTLGIGISIGFHELRQIDGENTDASCAARAVGTVAWMRANSVRRLRAAVCRRCVGRRTPGGTVRSGAAVCRQRRQSAYRGTAGSSQSSSVLEQDRSRLMVRERVSARIDSVLRRSDSVHGKRSRAKARSSPRRRNTGTPVGLLCKPTPRCWSAIATRLTVTLGSSFSTGLHACGRGAWCSLLLLP